MFPFGFGWYYDPTYVLVILAALIALAASGYCSSVMRKYSQMGLHSRITGGQTVQEVLHAAGIYDVGLYPLNGRGSSFYRYDKTIHLSADLMNQSSVTAVATAAHECGHAMQHAAGYLPNRIITAINPVMQISSGAAIPIFILGLIFSLQPLQTLGILLFAVVVVFQLVTLPSEFNASRRAVAMLKSTGIVQTKEEEQGVRRVLTAAGLTYVAALAGALLQLLRLMILAGGRDRD